MQAPLPIKLMLISPWLDVTCSDPRQAALDKEDPILAPLGLIEEGRWYAGRLSAKHPSVSPLFGTFGSIPPTLVLTGTHDLLHADSLRLESIGNEQGLPIRISIYPRMLHVWPSMPIPEAKRALDEAASLLQSDPGDWKKFPEDKD
jgi:acetyl esterase/lipase